MSAMDPGAVWAPPPSRDQGRSRRARRRQCAARPRSTAQLSSFRLRPPQRRLHRGPTRAASVIDVASMADSMVGRHGPGRRSMRPRGTRSLCHARHQGETGVDGTGRAPLAADNARRHMGTLSSVLPYRPPPPGGAGAPACAARSVRAGHTIASTMKQNDGSCVPGPSLASHRRRQVAYRQRVGWRAGTAPAAHLPVSPVRHVGEQGARDAIHTPEARRKRGPGCHCLASEQAAASAALSSSSSSSTMRRARPG